MEPSVWWCLNNTVFGGFAMHCNCLCRGELGDSLGALRHSVLGQLSGKDEPHSCLDLARGHSGLLVVAGQLSGLSGDLLEDVRDEGVQDGDGTAGNSSVRVHLQQDSNACQPRAEGFQSKILTVTWGTRQSGYGRLGLAQQHQGARRRGGSLTCFRTL